MIAEAEGVKIDDAPLWEIAVRPRIDAGFTVEFRSGDQFSGEKIGVEDVTRALGIADVSMLKRVLIGVANKDSRSILSVVDEMVSRGQDLRNFSRDVLALIRDLLVTKVSSDTIDFFDGTSLSHENLKKLSEPFSESDLVRFFHSLGDTESKLRDAVNSRYTLEMGLIKLVEMKRLASIESILERLSGLESSAPATESHKSVRQPLQRKKKL